MAARTIQAETDAMDSIELRSTRYPDSNGQFRTYGSAIVAMAILIPHFPLFYGVIYGVSGRKEVRLLDIPDCFE